MASPTPTDVAVLAANRIPFAKSNGPYAQASNIDMLIAAVDGLATRAGLEGERLDEVAAGAVLKHSRDFNLTREAVLGSRLDSATPTVDLQRACGTGMEAVTTVANKIALGQIDAAVAGGVDTTSDAPIELNDDLRRVLLNANRAKGIGAKLAKFLKVRPGHVVPAIPRNAEPRTGMSMGDHAAVTAEHWNISREEQDALALRSHQRLAAAYERGLFTELITPYLGVERDEVLRPDTSVDKLGKLPPVFGGKTGTMTAGNSSPLSDGAATVLLGNPRWAEEHGLEVMARLIDVRSTAVDFVSGDDGLLTAPVYAVPQLLRRNNLKLSDFDFVEIHEAFASQVLSTQAAWADREFCVDRLGLDDAFGEVDPERLNVAGSSLACGHPFAATGARIVGTLAALLAERGGGRGLISICAAGGQGVAAIMEV